MLQPVGQSAHTLGMLLISQGRALKRYSVEVSAPTGHSSITLPEKRPRYGCSSNVAITDLRAALAGDQLLVLRDVLREARAAVAEDAALAVERDQGRDRERLLVRALVEVEARVARSVAVRQVLQRALAALVADRAVERVVEQDELEHRLLSLGGRLRARVHLHAVAGGHRAGGLQLRHALDLDEAHAAGADGRAEPRLVTEDRDLDARLGGGQHERRALGHGQLPAVDLERDRGDVGGAHAGEAATSGRRLRGCG